MNSQPVVFTPASAYEVHAACASPKCCEYRFLFVAFPSTLTASVDCPRCGGPAKTVAVHPRKV